MAVTGCLATAVAQWLLVLSREKRVTGLGEGRTSAAMQIGV